MMGTGNDKVVKIATVLCLVGILSMLLPNLASAGVFCEASEIQVAKLWPVQGLVGVQVLLSTGESRTWVLCNFDEFGIGERRCYEVLSMLQVGKATAVKVGFSFDDTVPDEFGGQASNCADIRQWNNLEPYLLTLNVKQ